MPAGEGQGGGRRFARWLLAVGAAAGSAAAGLALAGGGTGAGPSARSRARSVPGDSLSAAAPRGAAPGRAVMPGGAGAARHRGAAASRRGASGTFAPTRRIRAGGGSRRPAEERRRGARMPFVRSGSSFALPRGSAAKRPAMQIPATGVRYSPTPLRTEPSTPCPAASRTNAECELIVAPQSVRAAGAELEGSGPLGGLTANELRAAYALPEHGGAGSTIAVVDAPGDPTAEADLGAYRSEYGLGTCTEANGCFRQLNWRGEVKKPTEQGPWEEEIALDLDMVSAACPECHIVLIEAKSAAPADMLAAQEEAESLGVTAISDSWNLGFEQGNPANANVECSEKKPCLTGSEEEADDRSFNHAGTATFVAAGDYGYAVRYPADSPYVIAVGGTTLHKEPGSQRGWTEETWFNSKVEADVKGRGGGSGCSLYEPKPAWQHDTACTKRLISDVSADGNLEVSPVSVYDSSAPGHWLNEGGTSASAPFMAGLWGLSMSYARGLAALGTEALYLDTGAFFDVTSGITGTCTPPAEDAYWCAAQVGFDGPTGVGTPDGALLLHGPPSATTEAATSVSATAATVNAGVNPNGLETTYQFEYGTTTSYGTKVPVPAASAGAGTTIAQVGRALSGLAPETLYHYRVVATNSAGSTASLDGTFKTAALPAVTNVQPDLGPASGGTTVSITGANFTAPVQVKFGSTAAASVSVDSAGFITAVAPAGTGAVDVTVTTAGGTSIAVPADRFTYRQGSVVAAWGANSYGQLGTGTTNASDLPLVMAEARGVAGFASGYFHNLVQPAGGALEAVGDNESGQLGNGSLLSSPFLVTVCGLAGESCTSGLLGVTAAAGGHSHTLAVAGGAVYGWGYNADGELGNGTTTTTDTPVPASGLGEEASAVSAGAYFSMALLKNGRVMAWGTNKNGQLGVGTTEGSALPLPVCTVAESPCKEGHKLGGVVAIAASGAHSMALLKNGTVLTWGENKYGQLGDSTKQNRNVPVPVCTVAESPCKEEHKLSGVTAIAAGEYHSLALLANGTVVAWGNGEAGQLADGPGQISTVPVPVCTVSEATCKPEHELSEVTAIAAGVGHSLALRREGTVAAWGSNEAGDLGDGAATGPETCPIHAGEPVPCSRVPLTVENLSGALAIGAGESDSLALARSPIPTITKIEPNEGPSAGGNQVTLRGYDFTGVTQVRFGAASAKSFTVTSPTSITATVPEGNGTVVVAAIGPAGTSVDTTSTQYRYLVPALQEGLSFSVPIARGQPLKLTLPSGGGSFSLGRLDAEGAVGETAKVRLESSSAVEQVELGEYVPTGQGIVASVEAFGVNAQKMLGPVSVTCTAPADVVLAELPVTASPGEGTKSYSTTYQAECILFPGGWNIVGTAQVQLSAVGPEAVAPGQSVQVSGASFTITLPQSWGEWLYNLGGREARGRTTSRAAASIRP
jgi:alpha-tubulin suppressor-like RCC1 family protein